MALGLEMLCDCLYVVREFLLTLFIATMYLPKQLLAQHQVPKDLKMRKGQVAIVTGGTRGIGLEVVKQLLGLQMHVIIACRSPAENAKLLKKLSENFSESKVEAMKLDLLSLNSVKDFASKFLETNLPLHLLVNNAGIMMTPYSVSCDGFESQLCTNYLGHFLLTHLLLTKLKETGTAEQYARIVNVSSCVAFVGNINFKDLQSKNRYSAYGSYAQSKLAQVLDTWTLQEKLSTDGAHVTVSVLHPGMIWSDLYSHLWWAKAISILLKALLKTPVQGGDAITYLACSALLEGVGGRYYENSEEAKPPKLVLDREVRCKLWEESCKLVEI